MVDQFTVERFARAADDVLSLVEQAQDQFTVEERRAIAGIVSELVQPLELKIMVLGRVALFYRYGVGGSSKDVDLHPYPLVKVDLLEVHDELARALASRGGHLEWMADGRGLIVYMPFEERTAPVELIFGGEDWIDEDATAHRGEDE